MADAELTFFTNPQSRGQIVRWALEEVGRPYETVVLEYGTTMKAPDYLAINPMGKVPAIRHRGRVATEVGAICAYLGDAFPEAGLAPPPADPARADYYRWMFYVAGPLEAASSNTAFGFELPERGGARIGYGSMTAVVDALDGALSGTTFLAGDRFSMADLHMSAFLGFLIQFDMIEKRPSFTTYVERHKARPAAARAAELDAAAG